MAIHKTARFKVKAQAVDQCKQAIEEFVRYVKANEPGTQLYLSLQDEEDSTRFLHYFIFDDEAAENIHSTSSGVQRFTAVLYPELEDGKVAFTDYTLLATTAS